MKPTKNLLRDTADTAKAVAYTAIDSVRSAARALIGAAEDVEVGKRAKEARERGSKAMSRLAKEIESRRPNRGPTKAERARKYGLIGAGVAVGIAFIVFVPRKIMQRFRVQEEPATNRDIVPTPAQAAGGEEHSSPPSNTSAERAVPTKDPETAGDGRRSRSA
jgi:hypothetical protein